MIPRTIYAPIIILFPFLALLAQESPTPSNGGASFLPGRNVVTFRPVSPHIPITAQSIDQISEALKTGIPLAANSGVTIHNRNYLAKQGVAITKNDSIVFLFSRGFEIHPCAARAALLYEQQCIPAGCPVIGFDYDDSREHFSFGQDEDIALLSALYTKILENNPSAQIVIVGNCNGAKVALELAAQKPKNLKALILLTPFISAEAIFKRIPEGYLLGLPFTSTLLCSASRRLTAYDPQKDTLHERLAQIDKNVPIFIGQRMDDAVVPDSEAERLAEIVQKQGNPFDGLIVYDPTKRHNNLIYNQTIQYRINRFLKQHGVPYNEQALACGPQEITR